MSPRLCGLSSAVCICSKALLNIRNASGATADWPGAHTILMPILPRLAGAERLATTEKNSYRGGPDSDRPAAGAARACGSGRASNCAGCLTCGTGAAQNLGSVQDSALSLAHVYFCRLVLSF